MRIQYNARELRALANEALDFKAHRGEHGLRWREIFLTSKYGDLDKMDQHRYMLKLRAALKTTTTNACIVSTDRCAREKATSRRGIDEKYRKRGFGAGRKEEALEIARELFFRILRTAQSQQSSCRQHGAHGNDNAYQKRFEATLCGAGPPKRDMFLPSAEITKDTNVLD